MVATATKTTSSFVATVPCGTTSAANTPCSNQPGSGLLVAVCDGMGGHENGDVASTTAVRVMGEAVPAGRAQAAGEGAAQVPAAVPPPAAPGRAVRGPGRHGHDGDRCLDPGRAGGLDPRGGQPDVPAPGRRAAAGSPRITPATSSRAATGRPLTPEGDHPRPDLHLRIAGAGRQREPAPRQGHRQRHRGAAARRSAAAVLGRGDRPGRRRSDRERAV